MDLKVQNRIKHDYTCELELKSLLIREKNLRLNNFSTAKNRRIDELIKLYVKLDNLNYEKQRVSKLKSIVKERIIRDSEVTNISNQSHEKFGKVVMLMIKNILKKPNFSGYTWRDDFYSDATYRVLKYLHNFDHKKTSQTTGLPVNAFSYISQIIHNSIVFIINTNNKNNNNLDDLADSAAKEEHLETVSKNVNRISHKPKLINKYNITLNDLKNTDLFNLIKDFKIFEENETIFEYPKEYIITMDEYARLKEILKPGVSIIKSKHKSVI